jgi:tricarballylate dehydrogenase
MKTEAFDTDVLVIGGGNAALCAALMAREAGSRVLLLESAPRAWRGGNSSHTRNLRCMHDAPQDVLVEAYPEEEYWQDLLKVTGGITNEHLARMVIRASSTCRNWMRRHGVHFQPPLSGALHVARTNAFFMGGGKALVNAYFRSAESWAWNPLRVAGGQARNRERPVPGCLGQDQGGAHHGQKLRAGGGRLRVQPRMAARGLGPERARRMAGGQLHHPRHGLQQGVLLKHMLRAARRRPGRPTQAHMVAIDARAPLYDGGICTHRLRVAGRGGEPRCRALLRRGRGLLAQALRHLGPSGGQQPGQIAYSIIDSKAIGRFMPPVFPGVKADSLPELARQLGLDVDAFMATLDAYNAAARSAISTTPRWTTATPKAWLRPRRTGRARSIPAPTTAMRCAPA